MAGHAHTSRNSGTQVNTVYLYSCWIALLALLALGAGLWFALRGLSYSEAYVVVVSPDELYGSPVPGHYVMSDDERVAAATLEDSLGVVASEDIDDLLAVSSALNERWVGAEEPIGCQSDAAPVLSGLSEGRGSDLACGSMSWVFVRLCRLQGVAARAVQLGRTVATGSDTHVVAEAYSDGRWVLIDPTFDLHYELDGRVLTALDMRDWVLENPFTCPALAIVRGASEDAPRIEEYYVNPYILYNIVTFVSPNDPGPWDGIGKLIPFVRRYVSPRMMSPSGQSGLPFESMNLLNLCLDAWTVLVVLGTILLTWFTQRDIRARRRSALEAPRVDA